MRQGQSGARPWETNEFREGDRKLNVLGLKDLGLGLPGCDTQQCCMLLPTEILITVLHVKSCGQLYCSKTATVMSPIPQALWPWDLASRESNSPLLESGLVLVTWSTKTM